MFKQLKYITNNFKVKYELYKRSQTSGKKVTDNFFWLKIKSRCFIKYIYHFFKETIRHSRTTRND